MPCFSHWLILRPSSPKKRWSTIFLFISGFSRSISSKNNIVNSGFTDASEYKCGPFCRFETKGIFLAASFASDTNSVLVWKHISGLLHANFAYAAHVQHFNAPTLPCGSFWLTEFLAKPAAHSLAF